MGTVVAVFSMKGYGYWKMFREASAKEDCSQIFSLFSEYAKLESTPFIVNFVEKNGQTYIYLDQIEGLKPGFFRTKRFVIGKKIKEKKVLFEKDGRYKILEEAPF